MKIRRVLWLLWIPTLAFAQAPYYGTTASNIRLSEGANPAELDRIPIRPGDVITPDNVRAAIQTLFDTGLYRSVVVDAVASNNGTALTFNLTPHYFFSTFTLKPEDLLGRPLSTLLRLPVGQKYSEAQVQEVKDNAQQLLKDAGYLNTTLTVRSTPDHVHRLQSIELTADAIVKDRARVGDVEIKGGAEVLPLSKLQDAFHVSTGDLYSASEVDKGVAEIQRKFLDRNFLNTRVEATTEYDAATNRVRLAVTILPGQETVIDTGGQIPDEEVRDLVPIFEEGAFDPDLIREGRDRIVEYLQEKGYFEAIVEDPQVIPSSPGNPTRIIFAVKPGDRHRVKHVLFRGNNVFSPEALQERLRIRPGGFLARGRFSDALAKADVVTIQNMYRAAGYEAAFVEVHHEDDAEHKISVVFDITENEHYRIERVVFDGNLTVPEEDLRRAIRIKEGDFFSPEAAEIARTALTRLYYKMGYPDVRIDATADRNPATNDRLLTYRISEGRKYKVGEILVAGNTRTADKFIRTKSGLKEYQTPYNPEDILTGQRQLYSTGLFSYVEIAALDRDTGDLRTVLIQVEEAKPIVVTPGVGVKEYAGPRVTLDVSHNNLWGLNRSLGMRLRVGVYEQQFQTTYHEPRLFNHEDLDGLGTLTIENRNQPSFKTTGVELSLQVRKHLSTTRSFLTTASYQMVNLKDININPIVRRFPDLEGVIQIARLGASFISDTRDDAVDPKTGMFSTSTFQVASKGLGSEVNFLSLFNQTTFQKSSGKRTRQKPLGTRILALSSRIGWKVPYGDTNELPITERYFAGGSTTLRGFGVDDAGPLGGGQLLTIGNVEYRVPLKSFSFGDLGGAIFYDTGNVFERPRDFSLWDFTHSAGLGIRFLTPLGPVRFDTGFNLRPKTRMVDGNPVQEERVRFFFTLGHPF